MMRNIKKYIPKFMKNHLRQLQYYVSSVDTYDDMQKSSKKIVITLAADYGNLGDSAITHAQSQYLKNKFQGYEIVEVPISNTYTHLRSLKKKLNNSDIITITGGGFMGDLYIDAEMQRQFVITKLRKNKIISFPQTIYFTEGILASKLKAKMKKVYGAHPRLTIAAREARSFEIMKSLFTENNIILTPDIVLYLDESKTSVQRGESVCLCIRDDKESALGASSLLQTRKFFEEEGYSVTERDTHIGDVKHSIEERTQELEKIWTAFSNSKMVVTDRLHGMIFCAITGTPCIAINNNNGKVKDVYDSWLSHLPYIKLVEGFDTKLIVKLTQELTSLDPSKLVMSDFSEALNPLVEKD